MALEKFDDDQRKQLAADDITIAGTSISMQQKQHSSNEMENCLQTKTTQTEQHSTEKKFTPKMGTESTSAVSIRITEDEVCMQIFMNVKKIRSLG